MQDEYPAAELTQDEVARLHPRTNIAVLKRLLDSLAGGEERIVRETILRIAERGPDVDTPNPDPPSESALARRPRRLRFQPVEYVDYLFFTDNDELNQLLGKLFSRDAS
jgi:hypothetical protein